MGAGGQQRGDRMEADDVLERRMRHVSIQRCPKIAHLPYACEAAKRAILVRDVLGSS